MCIGKKRPPRRVAVVTDSSATVPAELVRELGITVVPLYLHIDGRTYRDGVDISAGEVYRHQRAANSLPTTAAPSVGDFVRAYAEAAAHASGIVSIHISPKLSGIYNAAVAASQLVDVPVRVMDSLSAAAGQGFVVLEAARAAAKGATLAAVVERATQIANKVDLLAVIGTLEYLRRGGRIGRAASLLGGMLQIKPVLYIADGQVDVYAKPRTQARALDVMLQRMAELSDRRPLHVAVFHADVLDQAEALRRTIVARFNCVETHVVEFTPVMGAHTGPDLLGVAFHVD